MNAVENKIKTVDAGVVSKKDKRGTECIAFGSQKRKKKKWDITRSDSDGSSDEESAINPIFICSQVETRAFANLILGHLGNFGAEVRSHLSNLWNCGGID